MTIHTGWVEQDRATPQSNLYSVRDMIERQRKPTANRPIVNGARPISTTRLEDVTMPTENEILSFVYVI